MMFKISWQENDSSEHEKQFAKFDEAIAYYHEKMTLTCREWLFARQNLALTGQKMPVIVAISQLGGYFHIESKHSDKTNIWEISTNV